MFFAGVTLGGPDGLELVLVLVLHKPISYLILFCAIFEIRIKASLLGACELGLFEVVAANQGFLADSHKACQLQAHQQINSPA